MEPQKTNTTITGVQGNIIIDSTVLQGGSQLSSRIPSTVERVRQPVSHFTETELYRTTLDKLQARECMILHCYGYPGTGKSEIVRKLAHNFPFNFSTEENVHVKWHVECADYKHDIKNELQDLVKSLHTKCVLPDDCKYLTIIEDLEKKITSSLVCALNKCKAPILIVFEGVPSSSKKLLCDFVRAINNKPTNIIHIYITSRAKSTLFASEEGKNISNYSQVHVTGFTKEEGLKFLLRDHEQNSEIESAVKVFNHFSGNPLGLQSARGFCKKSMINYNDYMEWVELSDPDAYKLDENVLKRYGNQAKHLFQAILLPFRPDDQSDKQTLLLWKVMQSLSFLHHGCVPRFVVERFCEYFRDLPRKSVKNVRLHNKTDAGQLISTLLDYGTCSIDNDLINFHAVVLHAFQIDVYQREDKCTVFQDSLYALAGIATKDLRKQDISEKMTTLSVHVQTLLENTKEFILETKNVELKLIVAHLFEVLGAVTTSHPQRRDNCKIFLQKAKNQICQVAHENLLKLVTYEHSNQTASAVDITAHAKKIIELCRVAGNALEKDFITKYEEKVIVLHNGEKLKFLESRSTNKECFAEVKQFLKTSTSFNVSTINIFRKCKVFLMEEAHRKVFFAARLASVLHSESRVILYVDHQNKTDSNECAWYCSLAHSIAEECRKQFDVGLLVEHLSLVGGSIPILLKSQKVNPENLKPLEEGKDMCKKVIEGNMEISHKIPLYENGLLQETSGTTHMMMLVHRDIVRIFTRIVARDNSKKSEGWGYCEELHRYASQSPNLAISNLCFIYCAKFFCACQEYDQAIPLFEEFFSRDVKQFNSHSWGVYNYGRCIADGNLDNYKQDAIRKITIVLKSNQVVRAGLFSKLECLLQNLAS